MSAIFNSDRAQPLAQWEEVEVTFPSTANTDCIVPHTLVPGNLEAVNYLPVRKAQAADVYHDTSGTRKAWQPTYIILRCTVASAKVRLLLYVSHAGSPALAF